MYDRKAILSNALTAMTPGPLLPSDEVAIALRLVLERISRPVRIDIADPDDVKHLYRIVLGNKYMLHLTVDTDTGLIDVDAAFDMIDGRSGDQQRWVGDDGPLPTAALFDTERKNLAEMIASLPPAVDPTQVKEDERIVIVGGDPTHQSLMRLVTGTDLVAGAIRTGKRIDILDDPSREIHRLALKHARDSSVPDPYVGKGGGKRPKRIFKNRI